ncbi:MAG: hypothetical protein WBM44_05705 [Waterburya sp.]
MEETQQNILIALANLFEKNQQGTGDKEIANALSIDIDEARVCLKNLKQEGYIKLGNAASNSNPERILVMSMTPEGRLAAKNK